MRTEHFVRRHSLRLLFASAAIVILATLLLSYTYRAKAVSDTNISITPTQQLVAEYVALVDEGEQWENIGDANVRKGSWERGGRNPVTKVDWTDYRIVKMPGNNYQISIGLHKTKEELLEIIARWQRYDQASSHYEILTLKHHGEANVWTDASDHGISYTKYSGNVAMSERK